MSQNTGAGPAIRRAGAADSDIIWDMLRPVFRAGQTYAIDPDIRREDALAYWQDQHFYLAEDTSGPVGTFYIHRNRPGGGSHYCNCGFVTGPNAQGKGVARAMLQFALTEAKTLGFEGMVFNFVVSSNTRAVAIWESHGFETVGRVPGAYKVDGKAVDTLVMFKPL